MNGNKQSYAREDEHPGRTFCAPKDTLAKPQGVEDKKQIRRILMTDFYNKDWGVAGEKTVDKLYDILTASNRELLEQLYAKRQLVDESVVTPMDWIIRPEHVEAELKKLGGV